MTTWKSRTWFNAGWRRSPRTASWSTSPIVRRNTTASRRKIFSMEDGRPLFRRRPFATRIVSGASPFSRTASSRPRTTGFHSSPRGRRACLRRGSPHLNGAEDAIVSFGQGLRRRPPHADPPAEGSDGTHSVRDRPRNHPPQHEWKSAGRRWKSSSVQGSTASGSVSTARRMRSTPLTTGQKTTDLTTYGSPSAAGVRGGAVRFPELFDLPRSDRPGGGDGSA